MTSKVREMQDRYGHAVETELARLLQRDGPAPNFWNMMRYQFGAVDEEFGPARAPAGKQFRSSLCLLTCEAVGGEWQRAVRAAAAIELLHNFSLIHDDIEDGDPVRRHRPTVWKVWGEPQAINVGDGMFALSLVSMIHAGEHVLQSHALAAEFLQTSLALTEGQYLDMSFEERDSVTPDEYLAMIARKTSALIGFSCRAGAALGYASIAVQNSLQSYGHHLGTAFQITDDIKGIWSPRSATGKVEAQDVRKRKKTLPVLFAMEQFTGTDGQRLRSFYDRKNDDVDTAVQILSGSTARDAANKVVEKSLVQALHALDDCPLAESARETLRGIAVELTGYRSVTKEETVPKV